MMLHMLHNSRSGLRGICPGLKHLATPRTKTNVLAPTMKQSKTPGTLQADINPNVKHLPCLEEQRPVRLLKTSLEAHPTSRC